MLLEPTIEYPRPLKSPQNLDEDNHTRKQSDSSPEPNSRPALFLEELIYLRKANALSNRPMLQFLEHLRGGPFLRIWHRLTASTRCSILASRLLLQSAEMGRGVTGQLLQRQVPKVVSLRPERPGAQSHRPGASTSPAATTKGLVQ